MKRARKPKPPRPGACSDRPRARAPRAEREEPKPKPRSQPRLKVVWTVCDVGGRTVATFAYPDKAQAEALIAQLQARGKGSHFLRAAKEPMTDQ